MHFLRTRACQESVMAIMACLKKDPVFLALFFLSASIISNGNPQFNSKPKTLYL
jgi:hypothetical protein